jgi:two-component system, NtrC family, sensor kinase
MKPIKLPPASCSFRIALIVYVVAPLIGALALFGYFALNSIEKQVEKQMQKDLELVARAVQLPLSYALEKNRMGSIQQALESVFAIGRVYSAYVYDKEGEEIVRLGLAEPEPERQRLSRLAAHGERRGEYGRIAGRQVYSYFVPLTDTGGRINGLLQLTRKESEFSEALQSIRVKGAFSLLLLLFALSGVVLYGHHRALGMHLRRLSASMSRVANGERTHRFQQHGPMEIVELGTAFNQMLNSIDAAEQTIEEHRNSQGRLERELRQAEKLAAIGRLAAGTAHELGAPLSVIDGKAQRALRQENLPNWWRETLSAIRAEVRRMEYIMRQLLDFSRRNPLRCAITDPASLAAAAAASVEEDALGQGTALELQGERNTSPISLDPVRVQQALTNLLRNAIQCTPDGTVRLSLKQDQSGVFFSVEDDGPGVPQKNRSKVFEPFYTTKPVGKGTGLGLPVVHTVAEEHGGKVEVTDSTLGGAHFILFIPPQDNTPHKDVQ